MNANGCIPPAKRVPSGVICLLLPKLISGVLDVLELVIETGEGEG